MRRRTFLAATVASSATALLGRGLLAQSSPNLPGGPMPNQARELYQLRLYRLRSGPQTHLTETYLADALLPALSRLGLGPVGAFKLDYGPETPTFATLIPSTSADLLATLDTHLAADPAFLRAADPFWSAPATAPAFDRVETSLLQAFTGWPRLVPPAGAATKAKRILQLRTYESPSPAAHLRKVEMFNNGEFAIFEKAGCHPVFFAETLLGLRQPSLTYMLSFASLADLDAGWARFAADPDWKKLSADPHYAYEPIVSNITNLVLSPLSCSQL